jgi:hypothetical protein
MLHEHVLTTGKKLTEERQHAQSSNLTQSQELDRVAAEADFWRKEYTNMHKCVQGTESIVRCVGMVLSVPT